MDKGRYEWLDAVVVILTLVIVGFIAIILMFIPVPQDQLAVVSSLASGLLGTVVGAYAGYRWATSKQANDTIANLSRQIPADNVRVEGETVTVEKK